MGDAVICTPRGRLQPFPTGVLRIISHVERRTRIVRAGIDIPRQNQSGRIKHRIHSRCHCCPTVFVKKPREPRQGKLRQKSDLALDRAAGQPCHLVQESLTPYGSGDYLLRCPCFSWVPILHSEKNMKPSRTRSAVACCRSPRHRSKSSPVYRSSWQIKSANPPKVRSPASQEGTPTDGSADVAP